MAAPLKQTFTFFFQVLLFSFKIENEGIFHEVLKKLHLQQNLQFYGTGLLEVYIFNVLFLKLNSLVEATYEGLS